MSKNKKKPILIIAGCVAQAEGDLILKKDRYVDAVIGPQSYQSINKVSNRRPSMLPRLTRG